MKVKYIGTALPKYTNKILEVKEYVWAGVILYLPEADRSDIVIGADVWKVHTLLCELNEVEEVEA